MNKIQNEQNSKLTKFKINNIQNCILSLKLYFIQQAFLKTDPDIKREYEYEGYTSQDSGSEYGSEQFEEQNIGSSEDTMDSVESDYEGETQGFRKLDTDMEGQGRQNLYMSEKNSKKRLVIKDGKIMGASKNQRKDKGRMCFNVHAINCPLFPCSSFIFYS